jgi:hypothetical protein
MDSNKVFRMHFPFDKSLSNTAENNLAEGGREPLARTVHLHVRFKIR